MIRRFSAALIAALILAGPLALAQNPGPVLSQGGPGTFGPPTFTGKGHFGLGNGTPPLISSCGTSPGVPVGTDAAFNFTSGASATTCTVTPSHAYAARPTCVIDTESATKPSFSVSTAGVITLASVQASTRYYGVCIAVPGGL